MATNAATISSRPSSQKRKRDEPMQSKEFKYFELISKSLKQCRFSSDFIPQIRVTIKGKNHDKDMYIRMKSLKLLVCIIYLDLNSPPSTIDDILHLLTFKTPIFSVKKY